ncbi:hypothetical protein Tco_1276498, partial [Tanacetum coccineum]
SSLPTNVSLAQLYFLGDDNIRKLSPGLATSSYSLLLHFLAMMNMSNLSLGLATSSVSMWWRIFLELKFLHLFMTCFVVLVEADATLQFAFAAYGERMGCDDFIVTLVEADATLEFALVAYGGRMVESKVTLAKLSGATKGAPIQANMDVRHTMYFDQLVKLNATYRIPEFSCQKLSFEQQTIAISNIDSFRDKATQLNSAENKGGAVPLPY